MYFYLIPPIYIAGHLLFYQLLNGWLISASKIYRGSKCLKYLLFLVIAALALIVLLGCFLPESPFMFSLARIANIWFGVMFYMGLTVLFVSFTVKILGSVTKTDPFRNRKLAAILLVLVVVETIGLNVYGILHAMDVKVHERTVTIEKPFTIGEGAEAHSSLKAVLIGDLHMSVNSRPATIQRMVDRINEQDADLVVAAGDFLTSTYYGLKDPETYQEILRGIRSRYGVYAVYGNHDVEEPLLGGFPMTGKDKAFRSDEIRSFIAGCGFEILSDQVVEVVDGKIVLVCREDGEKTGNGTVRRMEAKELMAGIDTTKPVLVLEHEPVDFKNLHDAGADLVLSGHTHAGQIFPATVITPLFNKNNYGLKTVDGVQSIVTSGVGFYGPPLRVGSDSEIMVVNLEFSART